MKSAYRNSFLLSNGAIVCDWITFNAAIAICDACGWWALFHEGYLVSPQWLVFNISFVISKVFIQSTYHHRWSTIASILRNAFLSSATTVLFNSAILGMSHMGVPGFLRSLTLFAVIFLLTFIVRVLLRQAIRHIRYRGHDPIYAVIIGKERLAKGVIRVMNNKWNGYCLLGVFDDRSGEEAEQPADGEDGIPPLTWLGGVKDARQWVENNDINEVYICLDRGESEAVKPLLMLCARRMIRVFYIPHGDITYSRYAQMKEFGDTYVIAMYNEPLMDTGKRILKRTFDICFSAAFLCLLFPLIFVVVAIITKITMPGPIFFKQKRTGYDGKEFYCYKFRSMKVNSSSDTLQATKDDDRITKWGHILRHANIDETPQFWNVLIGDMSVVGPRPHMLAHTEYYGKLISNYMVRHYVRPGITGWAQVRGERGETSTVDDMSRRVEKDIWYIEHWSFWLDLQIILMTILKCFTDDKKAY